MQQRKKNILSGANILFRTENNVSENYQREKYIELELFILFAQKQKL